MRKFKNINSKTKNKIYYKMNSRIKIKKIHKINEIHLNINDKLSFNN